MVYSCKSLVRPKLRISSNRLSPHYLKCYNQPTKDAVSISFFLTTSFIQKSPNRPASRLRPYLFFKGPKKLVMGNLRRLLMIRIVTKGLLMTEAAVGLSMRRTSLSRARPCQSQSALTPIENTTQR